MGCYWLSGNPQNFNPFTAAQLLLLQKNNTCSGSPTENYFLELILIDTQTHKQLAS